MPDDSGEGVNPTFVSFFNKCRKIVEGPGDLVAGWVKPIRDKNKQYYYHRRYRRVPNISECEIGDEVCRHEANMQYKRDRKVDSEILGMLRERRLECQTYHGPDQEARCARVWKDYLEAEESFATKYGDMGATGSVLDCYMKQKHRMIWERRHGPVGTGRKDTREVS